jgi:hypothetical protein
MITLVESRHECMVLMKMTVVVNVVVVVQVVAVDKDVPVEGVSVRYKSEFTKEKVG